MLVVMARQAMRERRSGVATNHEKVINAALQYIIFGDTSAQYPNIIGGTLNPFGDVMKYE
jgi:hypothetical protein